MTELRCGTPGGKDRHRRRGEQSCGECRRVWNELSRERQRVLRASGWVRPDRNQKPRRENCTVCGERMIGKVTSDKPMHNTCRPMKYWSNAIQISDRDRWAIYERDGWTCQLCGDPVDRDLDPSTDRWSATLDHVVPRSHMLFPDDSVKNLRLAHRACNSARGAVA